MASSKDEHVLVQDRISRRRFIRTGVTLAATVGAVAAAPKQAFADCDQSGEGQNKPEHAGNGSDSDKGAGSDAIGCGRRNQEKPKLSSVAPSVESDTLQSVSVARIKA